MTRQVLLFKKGRDEDLLQAAHAVDKFLHERFGYDSSTSRTAVSMIAEATSHLASCLAALRTVSLEKFFSPEEVELIRNLEIKFTQKANL